MEILIVLLDPNYFGSRFVALAFLAFLVCIMSHGRSSTHSQAGIPKLFSGVATYCLTPFYDDPFNLAG